MSARGIARPTADRPPWLPPVRTLDAVRAGVWWDAISIDGDLGIQIAEQLMGWSEVCGPIVRDPLGPQVRTYFLVPAGTANRWKEPGTEVFGECCFIGLPGSLDLDRIGVHWVSPPLAHAGRLVSPQALRTALTNLRAER